MSSVETMTNHVLVQARARLGSTTTTELAAQLDIQKTTVAGWFNRRTLGLNTLLAIAEAVDMDPAVLLMSPVQVDALNVAADAYSSEALIHLLRGTR